METSPNADMIFPASQQKGKEQPVVVSLCLTLYDEESYPIKSYDIYGKMPYLQLNLDNVHFMSLKFVTQQEVMTKFTENELSTLIAEMKLFVGGKGEGGVKVDFFKDFRLVRSHRDFLLALPGSYKYYNVYKYNGVFISLCPSMDLSEESSDDESMSTTGSSDSMSYEEDEEDDEEDEE